jgi:cytochrome c peroxidase
MIAHKLFSQRTQHLFLLIICTFAFKSCREKTTAYISTETELGEALFFDPILSRDSSISCASCHKPKYAFADTLRFSRGIHGIIGERNTPSAMNQSQRNFYFWDGRVESLEEQAIGPIENPKEMDLPVTLLIRRLKNSERYNQAFLNVYKKIPNKELVASAIAAFENSLETSASAFDKYMKQEDTSLFSESAKRGLSIFNTKGKCFDCHFGVDFAGNDAFKNIGLYNGNDLNDIGRYKISHQEKDLGAFKVPGLRNIAHTAPYMHNGMFNTLHEVIDYYNEPDKIISHSINRDSLLQKPLNLTLQEKKDLENFMLSLSDELFFKKAKN